MHKSPETYIQHIYESILQIMEYTASLSEDDFSADRKTQDAVIRNLEVIGEASKKLDTTYKNKFPDIPWSLMAGMRDVLIHDYEGIDKLLLWDTVQKDWVYDKSAPTVRIPYEYAVPMGLTVTSCYFFYRYFVPTEQCSSVRSLISVENNSRKRKEVP